MSRIGRDDGRWADEARRRAEEVRQRAEELGRRSPAEGTESPAPGLSRSSPAPQDLLERAPRLFGREIPLDGPLAPPHVEVPVPGAPPPSATAPDIPPGPRTDVLPRLAQPSTLRARLDADFDRRQLLEAFGPAPTTPLTIVGSGSIAEAARALVAVKKLDWDRVAPGLLGSKLRTLAEKAGTLEARAALVKDALAAVETRHASTLVGFKTAGGLLEKAAFKAGVARELTKLVPGEAEGSLERMAAARQELVDVRAQAGEAAETLRELAGQAQETPWALQEIREIERTAIAGQWELSQTESRGQMLSAMDAGSSLLAEEPTPEVATGGSEARTSPVAGAEFEFTEEDLARIGTGLDPNKPPPQTHWSEQTVNTVCDLGRQQGGVTDEQGGRNFELAKVVLGSSEGESGTKPLEAVDVAAVLKMAGVDLAKVDPNQLQSAARYVSGATSLEDQQQKLRKVIENFQVLEKIGLPKMTRQQMVDQLWGVAKVPGHALSKLSDAEVSKKLQEVLSAVNAGPGKSEIKIGKHNLKLEVGQSGQVTKSSCKKPGFFSKVWGAVKKVAPIALTVLSFTPLAPFALAAQGAISLVQAIRSKSLLGIVTAAASVAGGAAGIVSKFAAGAAKVADAASKAALAAKAATAARVAKVANSASRALQGVSSLKSGNLVGGLASIGSGIASGLSTFSAGASKGLGKFADSLNKFSTKMSAVGTGVASFEAYKKAGRAVEEAKEALQAAQASGDARAIATAQKQLSQAESQKRAAVIGGAVGAASAASAWVENRSLFADQSKATPPAQTPLQSRLRLASQGLGVAQSVAARDYGGAAVAALSFGSTVSSAQRGGKDNRLNDAANLAQAGLSYYQAEKGRTSANQAVSEAQTRLDAAKRDGDAEAIRQAEADLKKAKGAVESALMGGIAAGQGLLSTAKDIGERDRAVKTALKVANESTIAGRKTADRLGALADDPKASPEAREAARIERERLRAADEKFQKEIVEAKGDPARMAEVIEDFAGAHEAAASRAERLARLASSAPSDAPASAPAAAAAEAGTSPGFASLRRPQKIGSAKVTKGVTVWEISQRTGVPVDRILEFNAQSGNPLDPDRLQIGQQILVPLDEEDIKFQPRSAQQVHEMKQRALAEKKARESVVVPPLRSSDEPGPPGEDLRSKSLQVLANDRAIVADDIKNAEFKLSDPTTWVDTKEEKVRAQARDAFKQSVDRLEAVLKDPKSTDDQIKAALVDKQTALNLYSSARGVADKKNEGANYATPVAELYRKTVADPFHEQTQKAVDAIDKSGLPDVFKTAAKLPLEIVDKEVSLDFKGAIQTGQDALHSVTRPLIDAAEKSGAPAPLVAAATTPLHIVDNTVDFVAGVDKGVVSLVEGVGHMVTHPVDTTVGLYELGKRIDDATPGGRAMAFLRDAASGKYRSTDEALIALRDRLGPTSIAAAQYELGTDVVKGVLANSIKLWQEGKYSEAVGTFFGENVDMVVGVGAAKLGTATKVAESVSRASKVEHVVETAAQTARAVDKVEDAAKVTHAADAVKGLDQAPELSRAATPAEALVDGAKASKPVEVLEASKAPLRETTAAPPHQRTDNFEDLYRQAEVAQVELGRATKEIAEATGGRAVVPPVKGRERALEKVATDYGGDAGAITDLARSSIEFDKLEDVYKALEQLGEDFKVVRVKDRFKAPTAEGYRDLLVNVETSTGHIAEIQLHLKSILDVKTGVGHALYEEVRAMEAAAAKGNRPLTAAELAKRDELRAQARLVYDRAFESAQRPVAHAPIQGTSGGTAAGRIAPESSPTVTEVRLGNGDVVYRVDEFGRTLEVDAKITGPHRGRAKGHRPDPPSGLTPGEHRGHLAPEGGVEDPHLVNVPQNIISEAPRSNLGPKKVFDNLLSRIAAQNPQAVVRGRHKPLFRPGETRPYAVEHKIFVDDKEVHTVVIPNK